MADRKEFAVLIKGLRDGHSVMPEDIDVDELISVMENARNLLYPDGKERPTINVRVEEGSVRLIFSTAATLVITAHALLQEISTTGDLSILSQKQSAAIRAFQKMATDKELNITIGDSTQLDKGVHLDKSTNDKWQTSEPTWVDAEIYISGMVTNIGGKTNPNIHVDTSDFDLGYVIVAAPEEKLARDNKNRLYKSQKLHIRIKQNSNTGELDYKTGELISFIDEDSRIESADEYLNRLIQEATPAWSEMKDPEAWLREIRGHGE